MLHEYEVGDTMMAHCIRDAVFLFICMAEISLVIHRLLLKSNFDY